MKIVFIISIMISAFWITACLRANSAPVSIEQKEVKQTLENKRTRKAVRKNPTFDAENIEPPVYEKWKM